MKVEKVKEENGELELSITASPEEVDKAFTDGLDVFIDQFQLRSLEGETALQKIYNAMKYPKRHAMRFLLRSSAISFRSHSIRRTSSR